jgi:PadR family transcriptional regulator
VSTHDPQMLKGVLSLLLLHLLAAGDGYGYAVVSRLQQEGFPDLAEGTVYPALTRLESQGLLESYLQRSGSGPARKYYRVTDAGRDELKRASAAWTDLHTAVGRVLGPDDLARTVPRDHAIALTGGMP